MREALLTILILAGGAGTSATQGGIGWQETFPVDRQTLGVKGSKAYFNLTPGFGLQYKDGNNTDTLTVLNETKVIDGVETT